MFLRNCWYVAAWSSELTAKPISRKILGDAVVMFRTSQGACAALEDRCCHKGLPLVAGEVDGDIIRCGYHGMEFAADGSCVKIPGQDFIPAKCRVKSYPFVEQDGLVWIWMGEPAKANPADIIPYPAHRDGSGWAWKGTTYTLRCYYEILNDNLLDLSHLGYVHKSTIGGGNSSVHSNAEMKTTRNGDHVRVVRWMRNAPPPPTYVKAVGFKGNVDRWQELDFWPGVILAWTGGVDAGTVGPNGERNGGFQLRIFDAITPETDKTTHYFWSSAHNFMIDQPEVTEKVFKEIDTAFSEDRAVLELQQQRLDDDPTRPLIAIHCDVGGTHARRVIRERILAEQPQARASEKREANEELVTDR